MDDTRRIHISLAAATHEKAKALAAADGRSLTSWIAMLIKRAFDEATTHGGKK
jgi:hypothetical protein